MKQNRFNYGLILKIVGILLLPALCPTRTKAYAARTTTMGSGVTRAQLEWLVRSDVRDFFAKSAVPKASIDFVASGLAATIRDIPQERIDTDLANWLRSSILAEIAVNPGYFVDPTQARKYVSTSAVICRRVFTTLKGSGSTYRIESARLVAEDALRREAINRFVASKFQKLKLVKLDLEDDPGPMDSVGEIGTALCPAFFDGQKAIKLWI